MARMKTMQAVIITISVLSLISYLAGALMAFDAQRRIAEINTGYSITQDQMYPSGNTTDIVKKVKEADQETATANLLKAFAIPVALFAMAYYLYIIAEKTR